MTNQDYRDGVLKLMQEKNKIEDEINNLTTILTKNGVGMLDPLVDTEGFPLSHIDIYQVRYARQRIICRFGPSNLP
ncbi:26s proteasome non-atpase regulatory subunit 9 [Holotrichia oblita]|uniref:26s proteasome non-atpase regulatory subunit 9 n=1 Tax=Holotrichia oblita TaxID=644536 RepID=A0ACB9TNE2_HOLOL|nr:26s proteasome non-atpase regulatory subunit 9 [Holotrichia oblita]